MGCFWSHAFATNKLFTIDMIEITEDMGFSRNEAEKFFNFKCVKCGKLKNAYKVRWEEFYDPL